MRFLPRAAVATGKGASIGLPVFSSLPPAGWLPFADRDSPQGGNGPALAPGGSYVMFP